MPSSQSSGQNHLKKRILIAINQDPFSLELVKLGAALCYQMKGELYLVYVYEVPLSLPLSADVSEELAKGDAVLDKAVEIVDEKRIEVNTDIVQARTAGAGILSLANNIKADIIILGMIPNAQTEIDLESRTVEYLLKKASCRVIVMRQETEKERDE